MYRQHPSKGLKFGRFPPPTTVFCNWVMLIVMHFFYICHLAATIDPKNLLADSFSFF